MQDSKEKQCLIFVRNNANDTADRIEAYAKKSGISRAQGAVIRPDFYRMKNRYGVQSRSAGFLKMRFTL